MFRKQTYASPKFKRRFLLVLEIALYLVGIGLLIQVFFVRDSLTSAFDNAASERLIITEQMQRENSTTYQNWIANTCDDVCSIQLFNYYIFNITNPEQVHDGILPKLDPLGPFIFNRYEIRKDVKFTDNGRIVNYKYEYHYILNEELTSEENLALWNRKNWYQYQLHQTYSPTHEPTEDPTAQPTPEPTPQPTDDQDTDMDTDKFPEFHLYPNGTRDPDDIPEYPRIYVLNPFTLAAFATCKKGGILGTAVCKGLTDEEKLYFYNYTIEQILDKGMESQTQVQCDRNPLCNRTQKYIVDDDVYVSEYTGVGDMHRMRELITFYGVNWTYAGGLNSLNGSFYGYWEEDELFENKREPKQWPYDTIDSGSTLEAFMMDKYRHVKLIGDGYVYNNGLELDKFIIDPQEYLSAANNPNNGKYYQFGENGLLNLTTTNGADIPQFTSKPFFLDAPYYANISMNQMGMRAPNRSIDDTYYAIDSKLGTVFEIKVTYMVSFHIEPCANCGVIGLGRPFRELPVGIIPQFYVVVDAGAPDAAVEQYKDILALLDTTTQYSVYAGPAAALCCFVIGFYLTGRRYCKWKSRTKMTLYMDDDRSYQDEQWDEMDEHGDNQVEFNAEDEEEEEKKEEQIGATTPNHKGTSEEDWDESMGFARRDTTDTLMLDASMEKTLDAYHNPSQQIGMTETSKSKSRTNWSNTGNDKNKKTSAKTKLLSKISSKLDTYSS